MISTNGGESGFDSVAWRAMVLSAAIERLRPEVDELVDELLSPLRGRMLARVDETQRRLMSTHDSAPHDAAALMTLMSDRAVVEVGALTKVIAFLASVRAKAIEPVLSPSDPSRANPELARALCRGLDEGQPR
jgi:hypothetical protein